jgi:hypothetical protein
MPNSLFPRHCAQLGGGRSPALAAEIEKRAGDKRASGLGF